MYSSFAKCGRNRYISWFSHPFRDFRLGGAWIGLRVVSSDLLCSAFLNLSPFSRTYNSAVHQLISEGAVNLSIHMQWTPLILRALHLHAFFSVILEYTKTETSPNYSRDNKNHTILPARISMPNTSLSLRQQKPVHESDLSIPVPLEKRWLKASKSVGFVV